MGEDINVKSIQLLESYLNSFNGFSSAVKQKVNSYLAVLDNSANKARQIKNNIQSIAERRKAYLSNAVKKMAAAAVEQPANPNHIAIAMQRLEGCKEAYNTARQYDEQCDSLLKKLFISIDQAKQQSIKIRSDLNTVSGNGNNFLKDYVIKLKSYSGQNG